MRRTVAVDLIIALLAALLFALFGARLIFEYFVGSTVNMRVAAFLLIIGIVAVSTIITRPIWINLEDSHLLTVYSWLGFSHATYDLRVDIASVEWVKNDGMLQLSFGNGKKYLLSRHSFFGLKEVFEGF
jgi:hypothetical protein